MSRNINIFVQTDEDENVFVSKLEGELGIQFEVKHNSFGTLYSFFDSNYRWCEVGKHSLVNDRNMLFENYQYQIEIGVSNSGSATEREQALLEYAKTIFDRLRATRLYRIMLVEDVQIKIDEYDPASG
ncbi:MAG: hypothetical protein R3E39_12385 [Anaerolineae bacterium]